LTSFSPEIAAPCYILYSPHLALGIWHLAKSVLHLLFLYTGSHEEDAAAPAMLLAMPRANY
jgi:hypothetical protein